MPKQTISAKNKLILLQEAASRLTRQINFLEKRNVFNGLSDDGECIHYLCELVDGVIKEEDCFMPWCSESARNVIAANCLPNRPGNRPAATDTEHAGESVGGSDSP